MPFSTNFTKKSQIDGVLGFFGGRVLTNNASIQPLPSGPAWGCSVCCVLLGGIPGSLSVPTRPTHLSQERHIFPRFWTRTPRMQPHHRGGSVCPPRPPPLPWLVEFSLPVAIMGASGSGKTTTLNVMACRIKPTSGELYLSGVPSCIEVPADALLRRFDQQLVTPIRLKLV